MRIAFKEWAIVVDALGRGEQIIILRKGGIAESRGGFKVEHPRFLLFPTLFHQQREAVISSAQSRYDEIIPTLPSPSRVQIQFWAEVLEWSRLDSIESANRLRGQHIWRDEVVAERFEWGRSKDIFAIAVRMFRLALPLDLPMVPSYSGCKSWVELETEVNTGTAVPVLDSAQFALKLVQFRKALET